MQGFFDEQGQLFFEIELVASNGDIVTVDALLDTGFTQWIAMNIQDIESLGWSFLPNHRMQTARGLAKFELYQGTVIFDSEQITIPVLGGEEISEVLLGLSWLENRRLLVDRTSNLLILE